MQNHLLTIFGGALILFVVPLIGHSSPGEEQEAGKSRPATPVVAGSLTAQPIDLDEIRQCRRNLHLIYEAIQAYRRVHQDIPMQLAELLPRYLSDPQYLVCPTARRLGLTSQDAALWGGSGPSTYTYEFEPEPIPKIISGGSARTMREWKRLQMGLLGSEVPLVRCHTHEQAALNLAFSGRIYESGNIDWEPLFDDVVEIRELAPGPRLTAYSIVKKIVVPRRDPLARPALIDLADYYNCLLDEMWPGLESLRPLVELRPGIHEFNGVNFDVRGALQLNANRPGLVHYPMRITNIVIRLSGRGAQLLVGAVSEVALGTALADCVFHLADGRQQRLRIIYGKHLLACCPSTHEGVSLPPDARLAWSGLGESHRTVRLYQCQWTNPSPGQRIESLDFVVHPGTAGPFLAALTIEPLMEAASLRAAASSGAQP